MRTVQRHTSEACIRFGFSNRSVFSLPEMSVLAVFRPVVVFSFFEWMRNTSAIFGALTASEIRSSIRCLMIRVPLRHRPWRFAVTD